MTQIRSTSPPADRADSGHREIIRASALVIDDEAPALDELSYLLRTTFSITPVDAAQNSADAFRYLQERAYDVVFLDVRMPGLNGIELANVLSRFATPPAIVFVTAYEEYAVRAFDIGSMTRKPRRERPRLPGRGPSAAGGQVTHASEVVQEPRAFLLVELGEEPLAQAEHVGCRLRHGPGAFLGDAQHSLASVPLIPAALDQAALGHAPGQLRDARPVE